MKGILLAVLAVMALACGGDDKKPAAPAQPDDATTAEKPAAAKPPAANGSETAPGPATAPTPLTDGDFPAVLALFDAITGAVVNHAGDCNGMADALEKVVVDHATTVARVRLSRDDAGLNDRFLATHGAHIQAGQARMAPVLATCQSNARVMKVFTQAL